MKPVHDGNGSLNGLNGNGGNSQGEESVIIVRGLSDAVSAGASAAWAASRLSDALQRHGIDVEEADGEREASASKNAGSALRIVLAGGDSEGAKKLLESYGKDAAFRPDVPESFVIVSVPAMTLEGTQAGDATASSAASKHATVAVIGADARGLIYGVLELADRVRCSGEPLTELKGIETYGEQPANTIRSISRSFCSEIEDKPWFYDKRFWEEYLTELATHRFNRLHLTLGISYDYGHDPNVRDNYFGFAYPFFVSVPGYEVRVRELADGERERNLEMLQYISREAKLRGLHFQLGLWNHAYQMLDSPNELHTVEGVDGSNHAVYCRDALGLLLKLCPDIDGVTIRTHYEGGIPEPSHLFWGEVMKGLTGCGRKVEIDMHPKGVDAQMLEVALGTGMPVIVSPKFWAEHMGLPYHQAAIRARELPVATTERAELMGVTNTYRRFTRYGYADYLNENRQTGVLHRIWPGTQRVLLWGDPVTAAGYGRSGSFCGSLGVELCEPMSFKARKTSGTPGGRELYKEAALQLGGHGWQKYAYTYRVWGRAMYNPDADSGQWHRYLRQQFQAAGEDCGQALAYASRILLLITTAHLPSASNNYFWPEMYNNLAIMKTEKLSETAFDTPAPHTFGAVSPLDTAMFYAIDEFADDSVQGKRRGKYSPLEVADRLDALADAAERHLARAAARIGDPQDAAYRRWAVDAAVQAGIGHFFARKLRAGTAYALFERTGNPEQLRHALQSYRSARSAWEEIVAATRDVYRDDIAFGYKPFMKGHWADRLAGIDEDIAAMEQVYRSAAAVTDEAAPETASAGAVPGSVQAESRPDCLHVPPASFNRGEPVELQVTLDGAASGVEISLLYRHAHQAESYETAAMAASDGQPGSFTAVIPGSYTDSDYPLVYFFELRDSSGNAWLAPGLRTDLSNQPYYSLRCQ
ncbi:hypothetical protein [Paenibacillus piri]|uniref:Beta-hexosaminidase bacterial type N-terminal domain-containing protein n=1 Tax=Paenibacillus piri TaxID=2547395 RepID=A0A4V2ZUE9_9BACL|nr:hypothetical protein [Paenibacillus piri]TDG00685.1 hypothetical protein E1757_03410 [Paenibacillus piri]